MKILSYSCSRTEYISHCSRVLGCSDFSNIAITLQCCWRTLYTSGNVDIYRKLMILERWEFKNPKILKTSTKLPILGLLDSRKKTNGRNITSSLWWSKDDENFKDSDRAKFGRYHARAAESTTSILSYSSCCEDQICY